jgi:hypothetical protein
MQNDIIISSPRYRSKIAGETMPKKPKAQAPPRLRYMGAGRAPITDPRHARAIVARFHRARGAPPQPAPVRCGWSSAGLMNRRTRPGGSRPGCLTGGRLAGRWGRAGTRKATWTGGSSNCRRMTGPDRRGDQPVSKQPAACRLARLQPRSLSFSLAPVGEASVPGCGRA